MKQIEESPFYEKISILSDDKLLRAFELRNEYQPQAAEIIIALAQQRNLIDENLQIIEQEEYENFDEEIVNEIDTSNRKQSKTEKKGVRPAFISIICILGFIISLISLFVIAIAFLGADTTALYDFFFKTAEGFWILLYTITLLISIVVLIGLWRMLQWAAWSYIILQIIGIIYNFTNQEFVIGLMRIAIIGTIIYYSDRYIKRVSNQLNMC